MYMRQRLTARLRWLLWVGMRSRPARNSPSGDSTSMHRTGLDSTGSIEAMLSVPRPLPPSASVMRATLRGSLNGHNGSLRFGVKHTRYLVPQSRPLSIARPVRRVARQPSDLVR